MRANRISSPAEQARRILRARRLCDRSIDKDAAERVFDALFNPAWVVENGWLARWEHVRPEDKHRVVARIRRALASRKGKKVKRGRAS